MGRERPPRRLGEPLRACIGLGTGGPWARGGPSGRRNRQRSNLMTEPSSRSRILDRSRFSAQPACLTCLELHSISNSVRLPIFRCSRAAISSSSIRRLAGPAYCSVLSTDPRCNPFSLPGSPPVGEGVVHADRMPLCSKRSVEPATFSSSKSHSTSSNPRLPNERFSRAANSSSSDFNAWLARTLSGTFHSHTAHPIFTIQAVSRCRVAFLE